MAPLNHESTTFDAPDATTAPNDTAIRSNTTRTSTRASTRPKQKPVRYGTSEFQDENIEYSETIFSDPCAMNTPSEHIPRAEGIEAEHTRSRNPVRTGIQHNTNPLMDPDENQDASIHFNQYQVDPLAHQETRVREDVPRPKSKKKCKTCKSQFIIMSSGEQRCKCSYKELLQYENVNKKTTLEVIEDSTTDNRVTAP